MPGNANLNSWIRIFDRLVGGEHIRQQAVRIGPTPPILRKFGLLAGDLVITSGKIVKATRDHPQVQRSTWHRLPDLLGNPAVILPSAQRNGSIIVVLALQDAAGDPVLVPICADPDRGANVVLSIYGKEDGTAWLIREINEAKTKGLSVFVARGFAATLPQPGSASEETIPSSPDLIPVDGTAKPDRVVLSLRKKSTES